MILQCFSSAASSWCFFFVFFFFPAGAWVGLKDISRVMVLFASFLGMQIGLRGLETAMPLPVYYILFLKLLLASREDWVIL